MGVAFHGRTRTQGGLDVGGKTTTTAEPGGLLRAGNAISLALELITRNYTAIVLLAASLPYKSWADSNSVSDLCWGVSVLSVASTIGNSVRLCIERSHFVLHFGPSLLAHSTKDAMATSLVKLSNI